jgi:hypothetical protein
MMPGKLTPVILLDLGERIHVRGEFLRHDEFELDVRQILLEDEAERRYATLDRGDPDRDGILGRICHAFDVAARRRAAPRPIEGSQRRTSRSAPDPIDDVAICASLQSSKGLAVSVRS